MELIHAIERRCQEISRKGTEKSSVPGADAEFYRGQVLEELDEIAIRIGLSSQ